MMLPGFMSSMMGGGGSAELLEILRRRGLLTNLKLCLDAGDINSAASSSAQTWVDVSGNGSGFWRGTTSGSTTTDPTFNGTPGGLSRSEYYSLDGGDVFQYPTTNPTWIQNLHKAGSKFTLAAWVYMPTFIGTITGLFGNTQGTTTNVGTSFQFTSVGSLQISVYNAANGGAGSTHYGPTSGSLRPIENSWNFVAGSIDIATPSAVLQINGDQNVSSNTLNGTPSTASATYTTQLGSRGNSASLLPAGSRMAQFMAWQGSALSAGDLMDVFVQTRGRFGI